MAQTWADNVFEGGHDVSSDMQNIETNFAALKSSFSGASSPASAVAGMPWFDTSKKLLKIRNSTNAAWLGVFYGDAAQKLWVYRNSAPDGWVIDSSVADRVLALKGGGQAYNRTGGGTAGTWTQPGHTLTVDEMPSHNHSGSTNSTGAHSHEVNEGIVSTSTYAFRWDAQQGGDKAGNINTGSAGNHSHTVSINNRGGGASHNHGSTYRPAAAVGTLQRLDI